MVTRKAASEDARLSALAADLRIFFSALHRRLREQADTGDLTANQKAVLLRLERDGPMTASALARAESMKPQSMGAIITALQIADLVSGAQDPTDGRQTIISLTSHFRSWISASRAARNDWLLRSIQARFDAAEQEQLADAISLLKRLTDDINP